MIHPLRYQHGFLADGSIFEGLWSALNVFRQRLVSVVPLRKIHYQNLTIVNELSTWSRTGSAHRTALSLSTDRSEYKYLRSFCSLLVGTHNVLNRLCQYGLRYHFCRRYDGFEFYSIGVAVLLITWIGSGGAAACVTAGRLAEADPSLKILVRFQKNVSFIGIVLIPNRSDRRSWSTYPWWTKSYTAWALSQVPPSSHRNIYVSCGKT